MYIEHVRATIKDMLDAIDDRDQAAIEAAYPPFRDAVVAAWQAYQNGTITLQLHGQAIPRLMTAYIADELARDEKVHFLIVAGTSIVVVASIIAWLGRTPKTEGAN